MIARLRRRLAAVVSRSRFEAEMSAELRSHLGHRIDDLVNGGLARDEATRTARLEFGALEAYKEECRDSRGFAPARLTHGLWGDIRLACRRLRATPVFLLFAVSSLALGMAVTVTSYAVLEALIWTPLGITESSRVAVITVPGGLNDEGRPAQLSQNEFDEVRGSQRTMSAMAATRAFSQTLVTPSGGYSLPGQAVTGNYFDVLGVNAVLGRTIQPGDESRAAPVLVLSDLVWRTRFAADPAVVGRTVRLGGYPFEIIGVVPRTFHGTTGAAGAWVPLGTAVLFGRSAPAVEARDRRDLSILGRLAADQTLQAASTEISTVGRTLDRTRPLATLDEQANGAERPRRWSAQSIDVLRHPAGDQGRLLLFLVAMVLVVACTNLANLLLARGTMRQHEIAVRRSLGASRWRLVRELCVESAVIGVLGAAAAVGATRWLLTQMPRDLPGMGFSFPIEPVVSPAVLLVTAGALLVSLLTFGLAPAVQLTRRSVNLELASESGTGDRRRTRRHQQLVRWQVAIAVGFFLMVTLSGRVLMTAMRHDPGMDLEGLAVAVVDGTRQWDQNRIRRATSDMLAIVEQESGIEAVAASTGLPFGVAVSRAPITTPDRPFAEGPSVFATNPPEASFIAATPDIFRTLGIPIVAGRTFDAREDASAGAAAVLNETGARNLFATRDAVGRQITFRNQNQTITATIVGIAGDTDTWSFGASRRGAVLYVPLLQQHVPGQLIFSARGGSAPDAVRVLQAAMRNADPEMSTRVYGDAAAILTSPYYQVRIAAVGAGALGLLTLILGMIGLYGVQSETVTRRTREVGVRVALGATARQIRRMVLKAGFIPVAQGIVLGLSIGSLIRLSLRVTLEVPIAVVDPLALLVVPIPVVLAAFLACIIPAHRAARVDPTVALRHL